MVTALVTRQCASVKLPLITQPDGQAVVYACENGSVPALEEEPSCENGKAIVVPVDSQGIPDVSKKVEALGGKGDVTIECPKGVTPTISKTSLSLQKANGEVGEFPALRAACPNTPPNVPYRSIEPLNPFLLIP